MGPNYQRAEVRIGALIWDTDKHGLNGYLFFLIGVNPCKSVSKKKIECGATMSKVQVKFGDWIEI